MEPTNKQKVSRKEFLAYSGAGLLSLIGIGSIIKLLNGEQLPKDNDQGYQLKSAKNKPNGYAGLNSSGKVPLALLPANTASVASVFGRTGAITAQTGDYNAAQVTDALQASNNLSDVDSVSTSRTNLGLGTAATQNKVAAGTHGVLNATDPTTTNSRTPDGTAGGDLSGTYPDPTVAGVNGVSVSGTPATGQVLTATSTSAANWQSGGTVSQSIRYLLCGLEAESSSTPMMMASSDGSTWSPLMFPFQRSASYLEQEQAPLLAVGGSQLVVINPAYNQEVNSDTSSPFYATLAYKPDDRTTPWTYPSTPWCVAPTNATVLANESPTLPLTVVEGVNDSINIGSTTWHAGLRDFDVALAPGTYQTAEALAAALTVASGPDTTSPSQQGVIFSVQGGKLLASFGVGAGPSGSIAAAYSHDVSAVLGFTGTVAGTQATCLAANAPTLPLTVVGGVNDTFLWWLFSSPFVIAPGTYTTIADLVAAMNASTGGGGGAFDTQFGVASVSGSKILLTFASFDGTGQPSLMTGPTDVLAALGFTSDQPFINGTSPEFLDASGGTETVANVQANCVFRTMAGTWLVSGYPNGSVGFTAMLRGASLNSLIQVSTPFDSHLTTVIAQNTDTGTLIAAGYGDGINNVIRSTDDGQTWVAVGGIPAEYYYAGVAYGNGIWVNMDQDGNVCTSTDDGVTWTSQNSVSMYCYGYICFDGTYFVAIGDDDYAYYSPDGVTWTEIYDALSADQAMQDYDYGTCLMYDGRTLYLGQLQHYDPLALVFVAPNAAAPMFMAMQTPLDYAYNGSAYLYHMACEQ